MKTILMFLSFIHLGTASANATEILWLQINPEFSYRDLTMACSSKGFPTSFYFGAEIDGHEIKKAVFQTSPNASTATKITLTPEEIKDFSVHEDKLGQLWLKNSLMGGRLLNWMLLHSGGYSCKPPQVLVSIDPDSFAFKFEVELAEGETKEVGSNLGKFRGKLKNGASYQAELQFVEKPYKFEQDGLDVYSYPTPPWNRAVSASGFSVNRPSAQALCQSDAKSKTRELENTCKNNKGNPSSTHPFCSLCNQLGNQWQCNETIRVSCRAF